MLTNLVTNKSTVIKKACPYCGKLAVEKSQVTFGRSRLIKLDCGHSLSLRLEEVKPEWKTKSLSGKEPFPYQYKTLDFIINSNFRTGIFHEQGVGKTICSLIAVKRFEEKLLPFVVVCKSSLKAQWFKEIVDWVGIPAQIIDTGSDKVFPELFKAFIISYDLLKNGSFIEKMNPKLVILDECQQIKNSNAKRTQALRLALSGKTIKVERKFNSNLSARPRIQTIASDLMKYHGIAPRFKLSFEDLGKNKLGMCECKATKDGIIEGKITINLSHSLHDKEEEIIETILHEIAHAITPGAGHKKIWSETCLAIGGDGQAKAGCDGTAEIKDSFEAPLAVLALSGTPIKNNAGEYFPVLNILHPEIFHSQALFERQFLDTYSNGWSYKVGGLNRHRAEEFKELTKDWIIRYERSEVLPDLPKIWRKNFFVSLGKEVEAAYKAAFLEFKEEYQNQEYGNNKFQEEGSLIAKLNKLRHLTGIAKIKPVSEFVEEFLEDSERKLCLFVHHKNVGIGLYNNIEAITKRLGILGPLQLTSENAGNDVGRRIDEDWKNNPLRRIMIASTLSAGEGKNWQMCSDAVIVERQWNPANEEQVEGRFPRPGISKEIESISITYAVALGTPDEFLTEIVEKKREICKKTLGNEAVAWDSTSIMKELSEALFNRGGKRWNL